MRGKEMQPYHTERAVADLPGAVEVLYTPPEHGGESKFGRHRRLGMSEGVELGCQGESMSGQ